MTPQKIRTKHAAQGLVASITLVASFILGAVFLIISAVTDRPGTVMVIAAIAFGLAFVAISIGVLMS